MSVCQRQPWLKPTVLAAAALAAAAAADSIGAQASGGPFELPRQVVAAGATRAQGAGFALAGTLGQANSGPAGAGVYQLNGGFQRGNQGSVVALFGDGFE
jgi:hypothetical protein